MILHCAFPGYAQAQRQPSDSSRVRAVLPSVSNTLILEPDRETYALGGVLDVVADPEGQWRIETVSSAAFDTLFRRHTEARLTLPDTARAYWLRLRLQCQGDAIATWVLTVGAGAVHPIDEVHLYQPSAGERFTLQKGGIAVPATERAQRFPQPAFFLTMPPGVDQVFYLRLAPQQGGVSLRLTQRDPFLESFKQRRYKLGLFFGILLALLFYNLFLYLSVRLPNYLYYILYLFFSVVHILIYDGLLYELTDWSYSPKGIRVAIIFTQAMIAFWIVQFGRHFLQLATRAPGWDRVMLGTMGLLLAAIPAALFDMIYLENIVDWVLVILGVLLAGVAIHISLRGYRPARYFALAFLTLILGNTLDTLYLYDIISVPLLSSSLGQLLVRFFFSYYGGVALEAILLSLALASLINQTRQEKVEAQAQALTHLEEANQLKDQYTKQLKQEVAARTAEVETQKQQLEEQAEALRSLDEAKSRFFANISHEFRTPLTLTIGPLEDLLSGKRGAVNAAMQTDLDLALRNSRRQLRLVNQILDVAKLETGAMKLQVREADLNAFLRNLTLAFTPLAERKRITFDVALPDEPTPLFFDPDQLEKVFANLLSNAFKFTPENGVIYCSVQHRHAGGDGRPGWVEVAVRDSGPGLSEDQQARVFERFYQTDESTQHRQAGTGIGLALVKELVALHKGTVSVESQPGRGTTFTVALRRGHEHFQEDDLVALSEARPGAAARREEPFEEGRQHRDDPAEAALDADDVTTVLIVDDNADIRRYVRSHLEPRYRVVEAADGVEGLEKARALLPDLVLSDVMMPRMDGRELCQALKQDADFDFIPVILLTAKAETAHKIEGLREGADDYITKPFNADELVARVDNLIASRKRLWARIEQSIPTHPTTLHADAVEITSADAAFLEQVHAVIEAHLDDEAFNVEQLAAEVGVSRAGLYRRLNEVMDASPNAVILQIRLERAAQLLAGQAGLVSEVAYAVGFKSVAHFSRRFTAHYGVPPSQYTGADPGRDV